MKKLLYPIILLSFLSSYSDDSTLVDTTIITEDITPKDSLEVLDSTHQDSSISSDYKTSKLKEQKEKALKDSVEFERKKASTVLRNTLEKGIMTIQPTQVDSIITYDKIYPHQVMQTDGLNFSDVLNKNPQFLPVFRNITSCYNNSLYWGIPIPILDLKSSDEMVTEYPYRVPYAERFSPKEVYSVELESDEIKPNLFPQNFLVPHTSFLWEGGIRGFKANMLNVRFTRPMSERVQLGVFTNYQHLDRKNYSHDNGNINSFYKGIYKNPFDAPMKLVSDTGTNPYTNEFAASAKLLYTAPKGSKTRFSYSYSDLRNDIPKVVTDTTDSSAILWKEDINYIHRLKGSLTDFKLNSKIYVNGQLFLTQHKNRLYPTHFNDNLGYQGNKLSAGGGLKPYILINEKDTASIKFTAQRDATERYSTQRFISQDIRATAEYFKNYSFGIFNGNASLEAGGIFIKMNDKRETKHHIAFNSDINIGKQRLSLNASSTVMPPQIPFDTEIPIIPGYLVDSYYSFGGDLLLNKGPHSVLLGYKGIRNLKARTDSLFWSPGLPPYKTAPNNFIFAPSIFTGKKVSLSSTWIFADSKPYVKSKSSLLFHIHKKGRVQHTFLSFDFMYWSQKDSTLFAPTDNGEWYREVYDINFHATVQIKTFRLYYKVDNFINRQNTYIPGFYMPGLILRWGFNWQITG